MALIAVIFSILLANQVKPAQINSSLLDVNMLPEAATKAVFALQIRQIQATSEATPAASAGNNLNVVGASHSLDVQAKNFQAISTIHSFVNKKATNKKYTGEGNDKSEGENKQKNYLEQVNENIESQPFVWDNCLKNTFRNNQRNAETFQIHMEIDNNEREIEKNKQSSYIWSKRNVVNANSSDAMKTWLEKYNKLKTASTEEIHKQKPDSVLVRKTPQPTMTTDMTNITTAIQIISITKDIFEDPTEAINMTQDLLTENNFEAGYTEDWFEAKDRSKIRFSGMPQTETYLIPTLRLEEGFHPFSFMSEFFSLIYPFELPLGLIKDIVWGKFTFPYSFLQSVRIESTFLGFIVAFVCIALVIPSYLIVLGILSFMSKSSCDDDMEAGALFPDIEVSDCNDRVTVIVTLFVVLICCMLISGMAVSNEQAHAAAVDSRNAVSCACADIAAWLSAAARELHHSLVPPVDLVQYAFREDLRNVETLLGEPIYQAIASESGIELVLDSLADITVESEDLATKISSLRDISIKAGSLASAVSDKIKDLARQIDNLKKHCNMKDAPLCDTVNTHSLELLMKFDMILDEEQLLELRALGVENLTRAISSTKQEFRTLPSAISTQTVKIREDILRDIDSRRQEVHSSSRILSDIVRHLTAGLHTTVRKLEPGLDRAQEYEFWRWTVMLACIVIFGFDMLLILMAILCGCGPTKDHAKRTLQVSTIWLFFTCLVLWSLISAIFLMVGHAELYVCQALWDPQYKTLSALLDRPSPLLPDNEGIFDTLFREMENITIDVSVKDVLRDCEKNEPAYLVFQLDKFLDVNKETSYFEWKELQEDLGRLASSVDVGFLKTISVYFKKLLNEISIVTDVDLAKYRLDYNKPIVGKDLPSLVDQLENVAAQVSDLTTAGKLETLATRIQRLHNMNIKPLEQMRADVVFKLTELELQLMPFRRKLNISLSHIYTAQFYIDNQGDVIAQKKVSMYVSRLISHAAGWRTHVLTSTGNQAARCRPLFAVFSGLRSLLCTKYIASLHGWWVCGFLLGVSWCVVLTPLCVKLWRTYGRKIRDNDAITLANLSSGHQGTPATTMCDDNNWNTPGPPPPSNDSW